MPDRYQSLTGTPVGKFLVKTLGLPNPVPLRRYAEGSPMLSGTFLVGGDGPLATAAAAAVTAAGGTVERGASDETRYQGLVFDASSLQSTDQLVALTEFFTPVMRSLDRCPHVVVLGTTPDATSTPSARIAQRALEGFTRSLGKEIGRGGTAQLVYADPDATDRIDATVQFLLSPKSAYVSGQVVRIGTATAPGATPTDPIKPSTASRRRHRRLTWHRRGDRPHACTATAHWSSASTSPQAAGASHSLMGELDGEAVSSTSPRSTPRSGSLAPSPTSTTASTSSCTTPASHVTRSSPT